MTPKHLVLAAAGLLLATAGLRADGLDLPATDEPMTLILDVEEDGRIQYSGGNKTARLIGGARVWVDIPGVERGSVVILAEEVDVDLEQGIVTVPEGAQLLLGPAVMAGDHMQVDAAKRDFKVERARGYMVLPTERPVPAECAPRAYFKSRRIVKQGQATVLQGAVLTTCPKDNPDFSLVAKRVKYDISRGGFFVYNAKLRFHGVTIPLIPWMRFGLNSERAGRGYDFDAPGYNSREGFFLPGALRLLPPESDWDAIATFRVTTREDVLGTATLRRESGPLDILLRASRRERIADDITDQLAVYRVPELSLTHHFRDRDDCETALDLNLGFGRFGEDLERLDGQAVDVPRVWESRALADLFYTTNACAYSSRTGDWYGAEGRISTYSSGETYTDLELFAGIGGQVSDSLHLDATLRQHFTGGSTPFLFDDVDIETEIETGFDWDITDRWRFHGWSRYDAEEGRWRDYQGTLSYRAGCLTYGLYYRDVADRIGFRIDLTGLTGGTRPMPGRSSLEKELAAKGLTAKPLAPAATSLRPMRRQTTAGCNLYCTEGPAEGAAGEKDVD